jgi:DnaJ-class molecular chaperone
MNGADMDDSKTNQGKSPAASGSSPMKPGDEAPEGTQGTGENVCPVCRGSGRIHDAACTNCSGTGTVTTGIGGA